MTVLVDQLLLRAPDDVDEDEWDRIETLALTLAGAVDAKGKYKPSHSAGVARLARAIGAYLGVRGIGLMRLRIAGMVHDVGKLQTPDHILLKPDRLTPAEYDVIKQHPVVGHQMLQALGLPEEARWVLHHHERGDGGGYPSGLIGDAIPLGSRILLVADAYDVMTTTRTYSKAKSHSWAIGELQEHAGGQFDAQIVDALEQALKRAGALDGGPVRVTREAA